MLELTSRTKRNLGLLAVAVLVAWVGWKIRSVINPLILGYLLAFILQPAVVALQRRGMKRSGAVVSVFGLAFVLAGVLGLVFFLQARSFVVRFDLGQATTALVEADLAEPDPEATSEQPQGPVEVEAAPSVVGPRAPEALVVSEAEPVERTWVAGPLERILPQELLANVEEYLASNREVTAFVQDASPRAFESLTRFFGGAFGLLALLVMVPVYAFFWLFEMQRLNDYVVAHIPARHRGRMVNLATRLGEVLSVFFRGRLTVCLLKGLFLTAGLLVTGVPYALVLGLGGGFLSIIPFLGGIVAFAAAFVVALLSHGLLYAFLATGIVFALAELLEGYVLMPRVLGESLGLTDVTVLFAITAGGALLGLFGVLIALPLAAAIKILYHEFVEPALEQFVEEEREVSRSDT